MYLEFDLSAPIQRDWVLNTKARSLMLDNWPQTTINSTAVFDIFTIAENEAVKTFTDGQLDMLKVFGLDPESFATEDWTGVTKAFFNFIYADIDKTLITDAMLYNEITGNTTVADRYKSFTQVFQVVNYNTLMSDLEVTKITTDFTDGVNLKDYYALEDGTTEPTWHLAFSDVSEQVYKRRFTVRPALITDNPGGGKIYTTMIELTWNIKEGQALPSDVALGPLFDAVKLVDVYPRSFTNRLYRLDPDSLYEAVEYTLANGDGTIYYTYYLKRDSIELIPTEAFAAIFRAAVNFETVLKEVPWWEKLLVAIVVVIIIVVAFWLTTVPGVWYLAVGAIASAVALTATVLTLVLSLYSGWLVERGYPGTAQEIGGMIVTINTVGKYAGYVALLAGMYTIAANGFKVAATKSAEGVVITKARDMGTAEISAQVLSWISVGVNEYMAADLALEQEEEAGLESEIVGQEDDMAQFPSPKSMALVKRQFESYDFLDTGFKMDTKMAASVDIDHYTGKYF